METLMTFAVEWWRVGLGIAAGAMVVGLLWRWALADLVLSELP